MIINSRFPAKTVKLIHIFLISIYYALYQRQNLIVKRDFYGMGAMMYHSLVVVVVLRVVVVVLRAVVLDLVVVEIGAEVVVVVVKGLTSLHVIQQSFFRDGD